MLPSRKATSAGVTTAVKSNARKVTMSHWRTDLSVGAMTYLLFVWSRRRTAFTSAMSRVRFSSASPRGATL